jgi:choline dehydrogenase
MGATAAAKRRAHVPARTFDVAVIGGGTAGCVVASRIAGAGDRSVVLIEAGPDATSAIPAEWRDGWSAPILPDWGFESEPDAAGTSRKLRRGRLLGGTSWLTRFAVRGAAADFDAWAARGNPGWSYDDVLPAFRRLEADAEFGHAASHGDRGPIPITRYPGLQVSSVHQTALDGLTAMGIPSIADHNEPHAVGSGPMPMSTRGGRRTTSVDGYLPRDRRPANLTILPDSPVDSVVLAASRAVGVRLAGGTVIGAARVVVAAGTYGSPAILMRSGIGLADHLRELGIDARVDLPGVGSNLADHPAVSIDTGWQGPGATGPVLHSTATWRSAGAPASGAPDLMLWLADPTDDDPGFWIEAVLLKPKSRGSVRLRSSDPSAPPRITLPEVRADSDIERLGEAYRLGAALADRIATAAHPRDLPLTDVYSIPHVVGTCAMGPSPDDGAVVDHLGRVHGVDGLFVVDASIIPDAPGGFPHLITIMVAEHLFERSLRQG